MNQTRLLKSCVLTIGAFLLIEFAVVLRFQLSFYGVAALVLGVSCFAYYIVGGTRIEEAARSSTFVYAFALFTGGVIVWVVAQLLSLYVLG